LTKSATFNEFLRGTVSIRDKKCMVNGKRYLTMYLVHVKNGEPEHIYIPRGWEEKVRRWVRKYREMERYMDNISDIYLKKIKDREE
jgi:hypothetical protein